jgi:hypothetical protein
MLEAHAVDDIGTFAYSRRGGQSGRAPAGAGGLFSRSCRWYSPVWVMAMRMAGRSPWTWIQWKVLAGARIQSPALTRIGSGCPSRVQESSPS